MDRKTKGSMYTFCGTVANLDFQMECATRQWLFERISAFCAEQEISERLLHYDLRELAARSEWICIGMVHQKNKAATSLRCDIEMLDRLLYLLTQIEAIEYKGDSMYHFEMDFIRYLDVYRTLRWKGDEVAESEGRERDPEGTGLDFKRPT